MGGIVKIQRRCYLILFQVVFSSLAEIPGFWKLYLAFQSCWPLEWVLSHSHSMPGFISIINFFSCGLVAHVCADVKCCVLPSHKQIVSVSKKVHCVAFLAARVCVCIIRTHSAGACD